MARKSNAEKQAGYRVRHQDRDRAKRILGALGRLRALLAVHPPGKGEVWLLSVLAVPVALNDTFERIERETGLSISDQVAQYVKAGFLVTQSALGLAAGRGDEQARPHDVQSAMVSVAERISKPEKEVPLS